MTYNGFYVGIVIQNDDPEKAGRVKILVPNINATLNEWHITDTPRDIAFDFADIDNNPELNAVLNKLKIILPWACGALPIFGGSASNIYDSAANSAKDIERVIPTGVPTEFVPRDFNNSGMGLYSIPAVGSHVWVFFKDGDPNTPVYFASAHGVTDYDKMNSDISGLENGEGGEYNHAQVMNTAKHTIQMDDTDNAEEINIIQYNGSNLSIKNEETNELAVKDKSLHVKEKLEEYSKTRVQNVAETDEETIGTSKTITVPEMTILCGGTTVHIDGSSVNITTTGFNVTAPTSTFNGNVVVNGTVVATGSVTGADCISGGSGGVSGKDHDHDYIDTVSGTGPVTKQTDPPN